MSDVSELAKFFAAMDAQASADVLDAEVSVDGRMTSSKRWAERAGVDYDELTEVIADRVTLAINLLTVKMIDGEMSLLVAMRTLACATAREFFEAGVLWEQRRNLPDLPVVTLEDCVATRESVWAHGDVCLVCGHQAEAHREEED